MSQNLSPVNETGSSLESLSNSSNHRNSRSIHRFNVGGTYQHYQASQLSYGAMMTDDSGRIISDETISMIRKHLGYCVTCHAVPVKLFELHRSRLNPLARATKAYLSVQGESHNGRCLKCYPQPTISLSNVSLPQRTRSIDRWNTSNSNHTRDSIALTGIGTMNTAVTTSSVVTTAGTRMSKPTRKHTNDSIVSGTQSPLQHGKNEGSLKRPPKFSHESSTRSNMTRTQSTRSLASSMSDLSVDSFYSVSVEDNHSIGRAAVHAGSEISSSSHTNRFTKRIMIPSPHSRAPLSPSKSEKNFEMPMPSAVSLEETTKSPLDCKPRFSISTKIDNKKQAVNLSESFLSSSVVISSFIEGNEKKSPYATKSSMDLDFHERLLQPSIAVGCETITHIQEESKNSESEDKSTFESTRALTIDHERITRELRKLMKEMTTAGSPEIVADIITHAMQAFTSVAKIQEFCLKAIVQTFGSDNENGWDSVALGKSECNKQILLVMEVHANSLDIQEFGCEALAAIAINKFNRKTLIENGVCERLISLLSIHNPSETLLICAVLGTLRILSIEEGARNIMRQTSLIDIVVNAMTRNVSSSKIQCDGCALLANMVVDVAEKKVSVVSPEIIKVLMNAILSHKNDKNVVSSAYFAFKNLVYNETNVKLMSRVRIHAKNDMSSPCDNKQRVEDVTTVLQYAVDLDNSVMNAMYIIEEINMMRAQDESLEEEIILSIKRTVSMMYASIAFNDSLLDGEHDCEDNIATVISHLLKSLMEYSWSARIVLVCLTKINALATTSNRCPNSFKDHFDLPKLLNISNTFADDVEIQHGFSIMFSVMSS